MSDSFTSERVTIPLKLSPNAQKASKDSEGLFLALDYYEVRLAAD